MRLEDLKNEVLYVVGFDKLHHEQKKEIYFPAYKLTLCFCEGPYGKYVALATYRNSHNRRGHTIRHRYEVHRKIKVSRERGNQIYLRAVRESRMPCGRLNMRSLLSWLN